MTTLAAPLQIRFSDGEVGIEGLIESANPFMSGGTVIFENFMQQETELDGQGDLIPGTEVTLDGEADVLFTG